MIILGRNGEAKYKFKRMSGYSESAILNSMGSTVSVPEVTSKLLSVPLKGNLKRTSSSTIMFRSASSVWKIEVLYRGPIVFHNGSSASSPVLLTIDSIRCSPFEVVLPAFPKLNRPRKIEVISWKGKSFGTDTYSFTLSVGGAFTRFEWRATSGCEVRSTGSTSGWKLVKLGAATQKQSKPVKNLRTTGLSSDGGEIVAVYGGRKKDREFQLYGTGSKFGPVFTLMALASAVSLEIHQQKLRDDKHAEMVNCINDF